MLLCPADRRYPPISTSDRQMLYEIVVNPAGNTKPSDFWIPTKSPGGSFDTIFLSPG
jgi:hypothetical protein